MDHNAFLDDSNSVDELPCFGTARVGGPEGLAAEELSKDVEAECEIAALSQAAGIDSSSLTEIQIMGALHQMR